MSLIFSPGRFVGSIFPVASNPQPLRNEMKSVSMAGLVAVLHKTYSQTDHNGFSIAYVFNVGVSEFSEPLLNPWNDQKQNQTQYVNRVLNCFINNKHKKENEKYNTIDDL